MLTSKLRSGPALAGWRILCWPVILALLVLPAGCGRRQARRDAQGDSSLPTPAATVAALVPTATAALPGAADVPAGAYQSPQHYAVKVFTGYVVHDAARERDFPIKLRYPDGAAGPLPLVLFSHGGGSNERGQNSNAEWGELLASAGYAVIHIAHVDAPFDAHCAPLGIPADECQPGDFLKEVSEGGSVGVLWYNRPRDASAVIDDLDGIESASGVQFDRERIGNAGHSGGAYTVMSLAGASVDFSPSVRQVVSADPRFKVFLACSPQGVGFLGLTETSWDAIRAPVAVLTGASDVGPLEKGGGRRDSYNHMPPGDKYLLYIDSPDAIHVVFGLTADDHGKDLLPYVGSTGLAFLDAYLRGLEAAKTWLLTNQIGMWSNGIANITTK